MKLRSKVLLLFILGFIITSNSLLANDKHIGIFAGGNYFAKTERPGFKPYNNDYYGLGHYILDEIGFSAQIGLIGYINDKLSVEASYRFPRFTSSVYAATYSALVPVNDFNTYFTQTMTTSWTAILRYHLEKSGIFDPYFGIGIDLMRVEAYNAYGLLNPYTNYFSKYPEDHLGVKHVPGLIIPFGVNIDVYKDIKVNANMNYTFMTLKEWDDEFPLAFDQNFGGFYFNVNLVYNIW